VQPAGKGCLVADRSRFAHENQKGCLKGVFGVVPVAQDPVADRENHRTVALHQQREGSLLAAVAKALQQDAVAQVPLALDAKLAQKVAEHLVSHEWAPGTVLAR
jgi:hypothetical protein